THDRIARADQHIRVGIDGAGTVLQVPDEAVVQATEPLLACVGEVQISEQAPNTDRQVADQRVLQLAGPAEESRRQPPWDAIGQEKVDVFMTSDRGNRGAQLFHDTGCLLEGVTRLPWK